METNPYERGKTPVDGNPSATNTNDGDGVLAHPILAYNANGNLEAHSVVAWLEANGVRAYAVEDNSGVSLFAFGTVSQFHKPQVFVDKPDFERATDLLREFEAQRDARRRELDDAPSISAECEECGTSSKFPASQKGTTQTCPKCHAFIDVGSFDWPDDFDFGTEDPIHETPSNADDAIEAASRLDIEGDWDAAIVAYRAVADRWPEHTTYITNCIAEVQHKLDASR